MRGEAVALEFWVGVLGWSVYYPSCLSSLSCKIARVAPLTSACTLSSCEDSAGSAMLCVQHALPAQHTLVFMMNEALKPTVLLRAHLEKCLSLESVEGTSSQTWTLTLQLGGSSAVTPVLNY